MGMLGLFGVDAGMLWIVAGAALVGALAVWRTLAGLIDHATRLHDTQVRVVELQLKYLMRARAIRERTGEQEEFVVGEVGDPEV